MQTKPHIWLRAETRMDEKRAPLTPQGAGRLIDAGFQVTVEHAPQRIFGAELYASAGCQSAPTGSWPHAEPATLILGLKALSESPSKLVHRHVYFAHAYKQQHGWQTLLKRFREGGGCLYDLEYLLDERKRRVAAFGYWAGFAGAGLAVLGWARQQQGHVPVLASMSSFHHKDTLLERLDVELRLAGKKPHMLVIGAKGRCGTGATELVGALGLKVTAWDMEETQQGGPFEAVMSRDICVNCVYIDAPSPPFITHAMLEQIPRTLSMICDVSCDPYSRYNPLPIYDRCTSFSDPCLRLMDGKTPLDLIAIDHLPSLLPRESSADFAAQLIPHLCTLPDPGNPVWKGALDLFEQHAATL
jgi:saccharopine dehydrogenase (NAD+, L-lysine forming)